MDEIKVNSKGNKKLENLLLFKMMWFNLIQSQSSEIKNIAIREWAKRNMSTIDCMTYAIECVLNRMIHEEENKRTDEI